MQSVKAFDTEHNVDSIIGFKRGRNEEALFQVEMCCKCCQDRVVWLTRS